MMNEETILALLGAVTLILVSVLAWVYIRLQDKNESSIDRVVSGLGEVVEAINSFKLEVHERLSEHNTDIALLKQQAGWDGSERRAIPRRKDPTVKVRAL